MPDRLTIGRLMLLTAGVAISLGILPLKVAASELVKVEFWLSLSTALLAGLSLPAPWFTLRHRGRQTLGPGGLFALTVGLGTLLLLIPVGIGRIRGSGQVDTPAGCMMYCMPLVSVWYVLAAAFSGHIGRRLFHPNTPWTERYGFLLAALWTPWGVWHLVTMYLDVL